MPRVALLGRDGVLLEPREGGIRAPDQIQVIPGSLEAVARLNHAGFHVLVASNQPAMGEGALDIDALNAVHQRLTELLARAGGHLDALAVCPHRPDEDCRCHKPRTGLFDEIASRLEVTLADAPLFGDDAADIEAARAIGARPLLLATGHGQSTHRLYPELPLFDDLSHAVSWLLDRQNP